jgi:hypothetical protein
MGKVKSVKNIKCVYCGITLDELNSTRDHVIPQSLFSRPLPQRMITVSACKNCNKEKSKYDDYLRDIVVADLETYTHPISQLLFQKLLRSARRNRSSVARNISSSNITQPLVTPNGIYLGNYPIIALDLASTNKIFSFLIKGLYYYLRQERLPDDCFFSITRIPPLVNEEPLLNMFMQAPKYYGPEILGNNIFGYIAYIHDNPTITRWFLWFYDSLCFVVSTDPSNKLTPNIVKQTGDIMLETPITPQPQPGPMPEPVPGVPEPAPPPDPTNPTPLPGDPNPEPEPVA